MTHKKHLFVYIFFLFIFFPSCKSKPVAEAVFETLDHTETGLNFSNKLDPTQQFNIFKYLYFYNGAGVGAGDFNNDGKIDLFFAGNQVNNKMYLNDGDLHFTDITTKAKVIQDGGWSTGVTVVDINNDGLLDIYICRVGNYESLQSSNQLLICQGLDDDNIPTYKNEAHEYGLDFKGFSTQAVFFDFDGDEDLDMYLLNHTIHQNGTFGIRKQLLDTKNPASGDRIYKNNGNNTFTNITNETGIYSSVLGYGLGIAVSDIDLDGYPDIYVGNDFHENDYLYINQRDGTFKEEINKHIMHTSQFSMGVDVADLNNDAFPEIISMDMLPSDPEILKRSLGEDEYDLFYNKLTYGYNYQYTRNNLQLNRRNGMFSEVGLFSGVSATDWSWAPLLMDFDNDGLKDLFVSNGIAKRLNDIDYISYISDDILQDKMRADKFNENDMALIDKFPQSKVPNRFFKNNGDMVFSDIGNQIEKNKPTYSNGAVYADFDNDGDLDIVVNNVDETVTFYRNKENDTHTQPFIKLKLTGPEKNINALGAKVLVFANKGVRTYENYPGRGFLSAMQIPINIGLSNTKLDSVIIVWPDNTYQHIQYTPGVSAVSAVYQKSLPAFNYKNLTARIANNTRPMEDITAQVNLNYKHEENTFQEFNREPLMPHMLSTEGPALAVADVNDDGLEDVFIGSSKWKKSTIFLQTKSGTFIKKNQRSIDNDNTYEDIDASFADINNDGFIDLVVASGGNEYYGKDIFLTPRVYLNNGKGEFQKLPGAFSELFVNASCILPNDFNDDGFIDLFIGGRSVPWEYGKIPASYLLQNDGTGKFKNANEDFAKELSHLGMVTNGKWVDIDQDGDKDLVLTLEWGGIVAYINNKGNFTKKILSDKKGWWNFVLPVDINNDGQLDLVAGNMGLNSRLKATNNEPVRLYYNDFDGNGKKEQVVTFYLNGKELQFANKAELEKQIPIMKKKFLYAEHLAKASLDDIFTNEKLKQADTLTANHFQNSIFINKGSLNFSTQPMPWRAQLSSYRDGVIVNANNDNLQDILLFGNYYENNIQMGRNDADFGTILINKGNGQFDCENINGLQITGQVRHIKKINIGKKEAYILVRNNDSVIVLQFKDEIRISK